uniref:F-box domain-containing protein n=1 Tax=Aegilops tauschii subsp. strangulata TaxID=200361 RepID=A0A453TCY3_AEGTS
CPLVCPCWFQSHHLHLARQGFQVVLAATMAPGPLPEYHLRKKGPPPALPDELVGEILLRIPPDDPASLLRASLVCKSWTEAVSQRWFRRSFHNLHPSPTALGVLHDWHDEAIPTFIPATASPFSLAAPDRLLWQAVDCRHGRALFLSEDRTEEFLVWEPITGAQQRVPIPVAFQFGNTTAAVFCAADGCNHHDCHGGPFCVVFVFSVFDEDAETSACVYSSETGAWGEPTLMHNDFIVDFTYYSSVLVGRSFLYFMTCGGFILEYDLARHGLTWFDTPDSCHSKDEPTCNLMLAEDGGLGLAEELNPHLQLWSRGVVDGRWVPGRIIYLESLPSLYGAPVGAQCPVHVLGFAEEANTIFVTTAAGLFAVQVQSGKATRVCDDHGYGKLIPIAGLYTPMPRGEHLGKVAASSC